MCFKQATPKRAIASFYKRLDLKRIIHAYGNIAESEGGRESGARERGCVSKSSETVFLTLERGDAVHENAV